jgi:hypothetical protein
MAGHCAMYRPQSAPASGAMRIALKYVIVRVARPQREQSRIMGVIAQQLGVVVALLVTMFIGPTIAIFFMKQGQDGWSEAPFQAQGHSGTSSLVPATSSHRAIRQVALSSLVEELLAPLIGTRSGQAFDSTVG